MNIQAAIEAVEAERELPGDMPDELWENIKSDRASATNALRFTVRATKENIINRLKALATKTVVSPTPVEFKGSPFEALLKRAGGLIECGFHVVTVRRKSTKAWTNVVIFEDQEKQTFAYAFDLSYEASVILCKLLLEGAGTIEANTKSDAGAQS